MVLDDAGIRSHTAIVSCQPEAIITHGGHSRAWWNCNHALARETWILRLEPWALWWNHGIEQRMTEDGGPDFQVNAPDLTLQVRASHAANVLVVPIIWFFPVPVPTATAYGMIAFYAWHRARWSALNWPTLETLSPNQHLPSLGVAAQTWDQLTPLPLPAAYSMVPQVTEAM